MKNQNSFLILFISLFSFTNSFAQINLDVEGDGTISGDLGIGINTPDKQLHILGDGFIKLEQTGLTNGEWGEINSTGFGTLRLFQHDISGFGGIDILANGNVGIGTAAPEQKLHIVNGTDVNGANGGFIQFGSTTGYNIGIDDNEIQARNNGMPSGLSLNFDGGDIGLSGSAIFVESDNDNVGIGTANPIEKFQIGDRWTFHNGGSKIIGYNTYWDGSATRRVTGDETAEISFSSNGDISLTTGVYDNANTVVTDILGVTVKNNGNVGIGTHSPSSKLHVNGKLTVTGSDFAERFNINETTTSTNTEIIPGMLVSIDENNYGELTLSQKAYDTKVAGIISGAGGVSTGMIMGEANTLADGDTPVALSGRVYCYVDASYAEIKPGDLLTTSPTEGHAMKVRRHNKAKGAIIGKAMTPLKEGKGLVLVLVSLQ